MFTHTHTHTHDHYKQNFLGDKFTLVDHFINLYILDSFSTITLYACCVLCWYE